MRKMKRHMMSNFKKKKGFVLAKSQKFIILRYRDEFLDYFKLEMQGFF